MTSTAETHPFSAHYDVAPEFYRLWLDPTMTYSSALWGPGDDLHAAQLRKLDMMIARAGAKQARRVLDVGCGWGTLARRLVVECGVETVVGLTVSPVQAAWVAAHAPPAVEVRVEPWDRHVPEAPYDAVISIGAFEHFAQRRASRAMRLATYREFFVAMHRALRPGGRIALQTIARGGARPDREALADFRAIDHVFPGSGVPWPSEVLEAAEPFFTLEALDAHGDHYRRTVLAWIANMDAERERALTIVDEATFDDFRQGFVSAARLFERDYTTLLRFGLRRFDGGSTAR